MDPVGYWVGLGVPGCPSGLLGALTGNWLGAAGDRVPRWATGGAARRATRLFCDVYNPQSKTYCKRLQVLCPEHSRDPKVRRWGGTHGCWGAPRGARGVPWVLRGDLWVLGGAPRGGEGSCGWGRYLWVGGGGSDGCWGAAMGAGGGSWGQERGVRGRGVGLWEGVGKSKEHPWVLLGAPPTP